MKLTRKLAADGRCDGGGDVGGGGSDVRGGGDGAYTGIASAELRNSQNDREGIAHKR